MPPAAPGQALVLLHAEGIVLGEAGLAALVGSPPDRLEGLPLAELLRPEDGGDIGAAIAEGVGGDPGSGAHALIVRSARAPTPTRLELTLHPVSSGHLVGVLTRVGDGDGVDDPLAGPRLRDAWGGLRDAMALATPDARGFLAVVEVNEAFSAFYARRTAELLGRPVVEFLGARSASSLAERIRVWLEGSTPSMSDLGIARRALGEPTVIEWQLGRVAGPTRRKDAVVVCVREASGGAADGIHRASDLDELTGLPNLVHLMSRLERSVERTAKAEAYAFGVVGVELSGLEALGDKLGTVVCRTVLDALVWRVRRCLRPGDLIARVGTDRLGILLDHVERRGSLDRVVDRIGRAIEDPYMIAGERIELSSVGAAGPVWSPDHPPSDAREILENVEHAVALARAEGSARVIRETTV